MSISKICESCLNLSDQSNSTRCNYIISCCCLQSESVLEKDNINSVNDMSGIEDSENYPLKEEKDDRDQEIIRKLISLLKKDKEDIEKLKKSVKEIKEGEECKTEEAKDEDNTEHKEEECSKEINEVNDERNTSNDLISLEKFNPDEKVGETLENSNNDYDRAVNIAVITGNTSEIVQSCSSNYLLLDQNKSKCCKNYLDLQIQIDTNESKNQCIFSSQKEKKLNSNLELIEYASNTHFKFNLENLQKSIADEADTSSDYDSEDFNFCEEENEIKDSEENEGNEDDSDDFEFDEDEVEESDEDSTDNYFNYFTKKKQWTKPNYAVRDKLSFKHNYFPNTSLFVRPKSQFVKSQLRRKISFSNNLNYDYLFNATYNPSTQEVKNQRTHSLLKRKRLRIREKSLNESAVLSVSDKQSQVGTPKRKRVRFSKNLKTVKRFLKTRPVCQMLPKKHPASNNKTSKDELETIGEQNPIEKTDTVNAPEANEDSKSKVKSILKKSRFNIS